MRRIVVISLLAVSIVISLCIGYEMAKRYTQYAIAQQAAILKKEMSMDRPHERSYSCPPAGVNKSWNEMQGLFRDAVVQIFAEATEFNWLEPYKTPNQRQSAGSGFFIDETGLIITNAHVIDQAHGLSIQIPSFGKRRFAVTGIGISHERDLALLRLQPEDFNVIKKVLGKIPFLVLGNSDEVHRSDEIMALGYPLGQQSLKSTTGVVSGREHMAGSHLIQISAPINPGSSGGPSLNCIGQVIGVNSSGIMAAQNVGYIIPSNEVTMFLDQLDQLPATGRIKFLRKPFLGIFSNPANDALTEFLGNPLPGGLYVGGTQKGSPLAVAGVKEGDMIYEIDGYAIDNFGEMSLPWIEDKISIVDYLSRLMLGEKVKLLVYRKGNPLRIEITFSSSELASVRRMYPGYEKIDYEVIGGMVIMELAMNHMQLLIQSAPELAQYAEVQKQLEGALVITHILPDSAAMRTRALIKGLLIKEINGIPVSTLAGLREALTKSLTTGYVTLKTKQDDFVVMPFERILLDEPRLSSLFFYPISPFITHALEKRAHETQKTS